jgi:hypothetical protein
MTVAELIKILVDMPMDAEVRAYEWGGEDWGNELEPVKEVHLTHVGWGRSAPVVAIETK